MWIRPFRSLLWFVFLLLSQPLWGTGSVRAQTPSTVDPYEVLYGQKVAGWRAASSSALEPSLGATQVLRAKTEQLIERAQRAASLHIPGQSRPADRMVADHLRHRQEAERLLREDKPIAAYSEAQQAGIIALLLDRLTRLEPLLTQVQGLPPEVRKARVEAIVSADTELVLRAERTELDALRAQLDRVDIGSAGTFLAKLHAEAAWTDASALQELGATGTHELSRRVEPMFTKHEEEDRPFLGRLVFRFIVPALIALDREELQASWQAHLASPLRGSAKVVVGTEAMQKLARAYAAAASANFTLAASLRSAVRLPVEEPWNAFLSELTTAQVTRRQERLDESGSSAPSPELALALAVSTYADSLFTLARIETSGLPLGTSASGEDALRQQRTAAYLRKLDQRVRVAAERVRSGLGAIPEPVVLSWAAAQPLFLGTADEQLTALSSLLSAAVYADLTLALAGSPPPPAPPESEESEPALTTQGTSAAQRKEVLECIKELQENLELQKQAIGFAFNRFRRMIPEDETQSILRYAIVKTCTRAKDLSRDPSPLFWKIYKQELINWTRAVLIQQRAVPALTSICETQTAPLDDLVSEPECEQLTQAMSQLDEEDRSLLTIWAEDDMSYPRLGERLGLKPDAARMRVKRALDRLRDILLAGRRQRVSIYLPGAPGWWPDHLTLHPWLILPRFPSENSASAFF